eukprot:4428675-Prorocentrum_lima.AAC.1
MHRRTPGKTRPQHRGLRSPRFPRPHPAPACRTCSVCKGAERGTWRSLLRSASCATNQRRQLLLMHVHRLPH